jgi:hypothetical protein
VASKAQPSPGLQHNSGLLPDFLTPRMVKFFLLPAVFITALFAREYKGEYQMIINNHVGGMFYVMFMSIAFSYLFRKMRCWHAVLSGLGIISVLEILQWFGFPFIISLTQNQVLGYLLGNSYNPVDFVFYGLGAGMSWFVLWLLQDSRTDDLPLTLISPNELPVY